MQQKPPAPGQKKAEIEAYLNQLHDPEDMLHAHRAWVVFWWGAFAQLTLVILMTIAGFMGMVSVESAGILLAWTGVVTALVCGISFMLFEIYVVIHYMNDPDLPAFTRHIIGFTLMLSGGLAALITTPYVIWYYYQTYDPSILDAHKKTRHRKRRKVKKQRA